MTIRTGKRAPSKRRTLGASVGRFVRSFDKSLSTITALLVIIEAVIRIGKQVGWW